MFHTSFLHHSHIRWKLNNSAFINFYNRNRHVALAFVDIRQYVLQIDKICRLQLKSDNFFCTYIVHPSCANRMFWGLTTKLLFIWALFSHRRNAVVIGMEKRSKENICILYEHIKSLLINSKFLNVIQYEEGRFLWSFYKWGALIFRKNIHFFYVAYSDKAKYGVWWNKLV